LGTSNPHEDLSQPFALADAIEQAWADRASATPITLAASPV